MNKDLKDRVFIVPRNILDKINHTLTGLNGQNVNGIKRAEKLLTDKKVKYDQLKSIIHDMQYMDKIKDKIKYDLCGGELMHNWAMTFLKGEREFIKDKKEGRKRADNISSMTGERKNSYLKKHKKNFDFNIPTNLIKSNSHKSSISPLTSLKLFEEINKIKNLMLL